MQLARTLRNVFGTALVAGAMLVAPSAAHARVFLSIGIAPPEIPVYTQPEIPGDGYIWTPGYWAYGDEGYYWVDGARVLPPYEGALWTPGYWGYGWDGGNYFWNAGYWGNNIGYYGGINYGFGYFGVGFYGGYWNGGRFFYNRGYNNFGRFGGGFGRVYDRPFAGGSFHGGARSFASGGYGGFRGSNIGGRGYNGSFNNVSRTTFNNYNVGGHLVFAGNSGGGFNSGNRGGYSAGGYNGSSSYGNGGQRGFAGTSGTNTGRGYAGSQGYSGAQAYSGAQRGSYGGGGMQAYNGGARSGFGGTQPSTGRAGNYASQGRV